VGRFAAPATVAGIVAAAALAEWLNGRPLTCRCGRIRLWAGEVQGPENSQQVADWYSLSHVLHGLLFYAATRLALPRLGWRWRLAVAVAVEAAWELCENSAFVIDRYRAATLAWGYSGDSVLNSMSDIGFMGLGFLLARSLPAGACLALGLALELVALAAFRDNLTLNVLMLVHPLADVRAWQAGAS
jgi:hypothetical protein